MKAIDGISFDLVAADLVENCIISKLIRISSFEWNLGFAISFIIFNKYSPLCMYL